MRDGRNFRSLKSSFSSTFSPYHHSCSFRHFLNEKQQEICKGGIFFSCSSFILKHNSPSPYNLPPQKMRCRSTPMNLANVYLRPVESEWSVSSAPCQCSTNSGPSTLFPRPLSLTVIIVHLLPWFNPQKMHFLILFSTFVF